MPAAHDDLHALPLAPTLAALPDDPRRAIDRLHEMRFRFVQLSAAQPGMRPRDMDKSARRDLLATLRRREMAPSGVDLWIPPDHFGDPAHVDRAVAAVIAAIEHAADLGRVPLSLAFPAVSEAREESNARATAPFGGVADAGHVRGAGHVGGTAESAVQSVIATALHRGVPLADHAVPTSVRETDELLGIGIDPVARLAAGDDPARAITTSSSRVLAARLADLSSAGMRQPPGLAGGRLDVLAYRIALSAAGFRSPVVLDARHWTDPWRGLGIASETWAAC